MVYIAFGCLAFFILILFDLNKVIFFNKYLNLSFALGIIVLGCSTIGILFNYPEIFRLSSIFRMMAIMFSTISLILTIYALFFALPFSQTYTDTGKNMVIDTGMYALCRHPGVIWFFFFYLFLWLASGNRMIMWAGLIWTIMDIIHVYIQDRWFFPITLDGFSNYQSQVPFLIPNLDSVKNWLSFLKFSRKNGKK